MNLNDIRDDLNPEIDFTEGFKLSEIKIESLDEKNTIDLMRNSKKIDISGLKNIKIHKNNSRISDNFIRNKKYKQIDLSVKPKWKDRVNIKTPHFYFDIRKIFSVKIISKIFKLKTIKILLAILIYFLISILSVQYLVESGFHRIIGLKNMPVNIESYQEEINNAKFDFIAADIIFKPFLLIPNQNLKNVNHIIKGGIEVTKLADNGLHFIEETQEFVLEKGLENIFLTQLLENNKEEFLLIENQISKTLYHFDKIENIRNKDLELLLQSGIEKLRLMLKYSRTINANFQTGLNLLGHNEDKKYLVIFQNNDEIRPTGGFMGSMGIITVSKGKIKEFTTSDVYAYEWEINKVYIDKVPAPKGLDEITTTFGLRDANYHIGFDSSAKEIKGFLNKIDTNIDGIVFMNQSLLLSLLKEIGPIKFDNIGEDITDENFSLIISTLVEAKTFKVGSLGTPKKILFDFSEQLFLKLGEEKDYSTYARVLFDSIGSRDTVLYSYNKEENSLLWKLGLTGNINYNKTIDFSYPIYTSISGNKSDRYMERNYVKETKIQDDCSISTILNIISSHNFTNNKEQELNILLDKYNITNRDHIQYIQGRGENYQFVRVLLPKNAIIEDKTGLVIHEFEKFKIAEFFLKTRRLEKITYELKYKLENPSCNPYEYMLYKQSGIVDYDIDFILNGEQENYENMNKDFYHLTE